MLLMSHQGGARVEAVIEGQVPALEPVPASVRVQFSDTSGTCQMKTAAFHEQGSQEMPCPP